MPAVILLLTTMLLTIASIGRYGSIRVGLAVGWTAAGALVMVSTETLSAFAALSYWPILAVWLIPAVLLAAIGRGFIRSGIATVQSRLSAMTTRRALAVTAPFAVLGGATLLATLLYPVTNWDSLTYHLPRIVMWIQNGSVDAFPTVEPRMIFSSVFVEYAILHIKVLAGGGGLLGVNSDWLTGLVQWGSYVVAVSTVSLLAQLLGASARGQWAAAITAASIPVAILQASTTQVDLTAGAWCLIATYCVLRASGEIGERFSWLALLAGVAVALAVMTKATSYVILAPFVALALSRAIKSARPENAWGPLVKMVVAAALAFALVVGPVYARNASLLGGDFLGTTAPSNEQTLNPLASPKGLLTNTVMNLSMLTATPVPSVNGAIEQAVRGVLTTLGMEGQVAAIDSVQWGPYYLPHQANSHDHAGAPFTVLAIAVAIGLIMVQRKRSSADWGYLGAAGGSILLLCALVLWQPWVNRLLLSNLLLLAPIVGLAVRYPAQQRELPLASATRVTSPALAPRLVSALVATSLLFALTIVTFHASRPLTSVAPPGSMRVQLQSFWNTQYADRGLVELGSENAAALRAVSQAIGEAGVDSLCIDQRGGDFFIYPIMAENPLVSFRYLTDTAGMGGKDYEPLPCEATLSIVQEGTASAPGAPPALDIDASRFIAGPVQTSRGTMLLYWSHP